MKGTSTKLPKTLYVIADDAGSYVVEDSLDGFSATTAVVGVYDLRTTGCVQVAPTFVESPFPDAAPKSTKTKARSKR